MKAKAYLPLFMTLLLAVPLLVGAVAAGPGETEKVSLQVDGMSCGHCAERVEASLKEVVGVQAASVDLESGMAEVVVAKGAVERAALEKAVVDAGFTVGEAGGQDGNGKPAKAKDKSKAGHDGKSCPRDDHHEGSHEHGEHHG